MMIFSGLPALAGPAMATSRPRTVSTAAILANAEACIALLLSLTSGRAQIQGAGVARDCGRRSLTSRLWDEAVT